jgi:hypothetical protein
MALRLSAIDPALLVRRNRRDSVPSYDQTPYQDVANQAMTDPACRHGQVIAASVTYEPNDLEGTTPRSEKLRIQHAVRAYGMPDGHTFDWLPDRTLDDGSVVVTFRVRPRGTPRPRRKVQNQLANILNEDQPDQSDSGQSGGTQSETNHRVRRGIRELVEV